MSAQDNGGPAFPHTLPGHQIEKGMTLRDYFIAHAPAEPQPWFQAVMPEPCPSYSSGAAPDHLRDEIKKYNSEDGCGGYSEEAEAWMKNARIRYSAWVYEADKQRFLQWPAAWADAMLEARK